jgi:hypothetical protein
VPDTLPSGADKNFSLVYYTVINEATMSTSTQEHKKTKRKSVAGGGDVNVVLNEASSSAGPAFRRSLLMKDGDRPDAI